MQKCKESRERSWIAVCSFGTFLAKQKSTKFFNQVSACIPNEDIRNEGKKHFKPLEAF